MTQKRFLIIKMVEEIGNKRTYSLAIKSKTSFGGFSILKPRASIEYSDYLSRVRILIF